MKSEDLLPFIPFDEWKLGQDIHRESGATGNSYGAMLATLVRRGLVEEKLHPDCTPAYPKYYYRRAR